MSFLRGNDLFSAVDLPLEAYDSVKEEDLRIPACKPGEEGLFFHLAWAGTFGDRRNDPDLQERNVQATINALRLAVRLGCTAFVGAGSQAEYGPVFVPLRSDTPKHPQTEYGKAKKRAGEAVTKLGRELGIRTSWCRFLSVYGPWDTRGTMVDYAIRTLLEKKEARFSHGEQIWDYLFSEDAAMALYLTALRAPGGRAYPVGSGDGRPLKEYIRMIRDAADPEGVILLGSIPGPQEPYPVLCADLSELQEDTGFSPTYSFEEGIRKTVLWYQKSLESKRNAPE